MNCRTRSGYSDHSRHTAAVNRANGCGSASEPPNASFKCLSHDGGTCRDFSGRGLVGELPKDNYVYTNLPQLTRLDLSGNELGYGVVPIPNSIHKLINLEYL